MFPAVSATNVVPDSKNLASMIRHLPWDIYFNLPDIHVMLPSYMTGALSVGLPVRVINHNIHGVVKQAVWEKTPQHISL